MTACKGCDEQIKPGNSKPEVHMEIVEYPYNPEWGLVRHDAGVFCGLACLARYCDGQLERQGLDRVRDVDFPCSHCSHPGRRHNLLGACIELGCKCPGYEEAF